MRLIIPILFLISSCSCNYHLKRAEAKCGTRKIIDTLLVHDTLLINSVQLDTLFTPIQGDTVYLTKDRLSIKYVKLAGDKVFIEGKCDTIKIDRLIKVPCTTTILEPTVSKWHIALYILIALLVGYLVRWIKR